MTAPLSQHTCDRLKLLCRIHDQKTAAEIVGVCEDVVVKVKRRGWRAVPPGRRRRPMPSDFAIQQRHASQKELARHYRTSPSNICRWRKELRA
jgi:hypothetical protein